MISGRYPEGTFEIGKGENKNIIFHIEDKESVFEDTDNLLFAIKDIDNNVKYNYSMPISEVPHEENKYDFIVELESELTASFCVGTYFFDLTLDKNGKKTPLTKIRTISIVDTVGATI